MKSKRLIPSIALAAISLGAWAPRGSCQIVGYAPIPIVPGYNFVANQFDYGDNSLTNVITAYSSPPPGTAVYLWNLVNQQFDPPSVLTTNGWTTNFNLTPTTPFVVSSPSTWVLTFDGRIPSGTFTIPYPGGGKFSLLAPYIPFDQSPVRELGSTNMAFPKIEGENVYLYDSTNRNFTDAFTFFTGYNWFDPRGVVGTNGPIIYPGRSFFAQNLGPNTNWVQTYNPPTPMAQLAQTSSTSAIIQGIRVTGSTVTLTILNPQQTAYNVQFSSDGRAWTTLASNQTGTIWRAPLPSPAPGYFRLAKP